MRIFPILLSFFCLNFSLWAQTNISGIINFYAAVSDVDYCTNTLTVDQSTGFEEGMNVIIIQMQGASINASNNPVYGEVTDLGGAGLFERATIATITGNSIVLEHALVNTYNLAGQVQVVSFPSYEVATISDTIRAAPWDGQKGGVVAIEADSLIMQSDIDVSGQGFRGGRSDIAASNNCNFLTNASNYAYNLGNWRGALKGEGVALPVENQETGRGALANAGGGGNDHNTGGGGGANLTSGGQGGENMEPSNFGCDGPYPGIGGKALPELENRLFMGGGGGAGHENNDEGSDGGHGGGIVILSAARLAANDFKILANGLTAGTSLGDGAGGGGGGGTVWLDLAGILGGVNVEVKGGNGGTSDNNNFDRCIGAGGGGSGGVLYINPVFEQNFDLSAGAAGLSINSNLTECPDGAYGTTSGTDGLKLEIGTIPEGTETNSPPEIAEISENVSACLGDELDLIAVVEGFDLFFQWQLDSGSGFQDLEDDETFSGTQTSILSISNVSEAFSGYTFRLSVDNDCFADITSGSINIDLTLLPTAEFDFTVDGLMVDFSNQSENGSAYSWDFGDGNGSDEINPSHEYAMPGTYEVTLTVSNDCGEETFSQQVILADAPVAAFSVTPMIGCAPVTVQFSNESSGNPTSLAWIFPGGDPAFSNEEIALVTYDEAGTYSATLIASNAIGVDTLTLENAITVNAAPQADFEFSVDGLTATFTNLAETADSYYWVFGDDDISIEENPVHTFPGPGIYDVFFRVTNPCGVTSVTLPVTIGTVPVPDFSVNLASGCAPLTVQFSNESTGDYDDLEWSFPGGTPETSTEVNPTVTYEQAGEYNVTLSLFGPLGDPVVIKESFIDIRPFPMPNFSYEINGLTVTFTNNSEFANSFTWSFGDGTTSDENNPTHTFPTQGVYEVTLNALNNFCGNAFSETIFVSPTATAEQEDNFGLKVYPNPFSENLTLEVNKLEDNKPLTVELRNTTGKLLKSFAVTRTTTLPLSEYPAGVYYLLIRVEQQVFSKKVVKF